jgi:hypothetical protein
MGKQILYLVAVVVVMFIASRYMRKIRSKSDEIPEEGELPSAEDLETTDDTAK